MLFLERVVAPHFITFLASVVLLGISSLFLNPAQLMILGYVLGAYGSGHSISFLRKKITGEE